MKNSNSNSNNNFNSRFNSNADRKFEKQVSHLSGFIGMPMWNGRNPTLSEIREYDRLILEKQAQQFKPKVSLLKQLSRSVGSIFATVFEKVETRKLTQTSATLVTSVRVNNVTENMRVSRRTTKKTSQSKQPIVTTGTECCG